MIVLDGAGTAPLANNYGTAAFTQPGQPGGPPVPDRPRRRGRRPRLRRDPLRLRPPARGRPGDDAVPRPGRSRRRRRSPASSPTPTPRSSRTGALLGVSVFGISATRPEPTAQDIGLLAPHVDYVSPMVYPSHWGSGEYGVADPVRQPADIVARVARRLRAHRRRQRRRRGAVAAGLLVRRRGRTARPRSRAQIDAARAAGVEGFLLWNPKSTYTIDALDPPTAPQSDRVTGRLSRDRPTWPRNPREPRASTVGGHDRRARCHVDVADGVATITLDSPGQPQRPVEPARRRPQRGARRGRGRRRRRVRAGDRADPRRRRRSAPAPTSRSGATGPPDSSPMVARAAAADGRRRADDRRRRRPGPRRRHRPDGVVRPRRRAPRPDVRPDRGAHRRGRGDHLRADPAPGERQPARRGVPHRRAVRRRASPATSGSSPTSPTTSPATVAALCDGIRHGRPAGRRRDQADAAHGAGARPRRGLRADAGAVRRAVRRPRRRRGDGRLRREAPPVLAVPIRVCPVGDRPDRAASSNGQDADGGARCRPRRRAPAGPRRPAG